MKHNIYTMTDLQSCYDQQLPNVGSIVEESVGRNHNAMILYTKIMPKFERHISTAYGVSEGHYGRDIDLAGTGQGNKFSGDMCRDISCLIIKQLEKKNLGIEFLSKTTQVNTLVAAVSFVDNNDLAVDGDNSKVRMQKIVDLYDTLYKAIGGFSQEEKSKFYSWKWVWQQGRKRMKVVKVVIKINNKPIKQLGPKDEEKTLGINIGPSLKWDE